MDLQPLFDEALYVANRLLEKGARDDALVVLRLLAENEAFGAVRVIACVNCGIVSEQRGDATGAMAWYDRAVALESSQASRLAAQRKADLLARMGRTADALAVYLELLAGPLEAKDEQAIRAAGTALDSAS